MDLELGIEEKVEVSLASINKEDHNLYKVVAIITLLTSRNVDNLDIDGNVLAADVKSQYNGIFVNLNHTLVVEYGVIFIGLKIYRILGNPEEEGMSSSREYGLLSEATLMDFKTMPNDKITLLHSNS